MFILTRPLISCNLIVWDVAKGQNTNINSSPVAGGGRGTNNNCSHFAGTTAGGEGGGGWQIMRPRPRGVSSPNERGGGRRDRERRDGGDRAGH